MSDLIVILDSSDEDEIEEPPPKKSKLENNDTTSPSYSINNHEINGSDNDVIEIVSDDEEENFDTKKPSEKFSETKVFYVIQQDIKLPDKKQTDKINTEKILVETDPKNDNFNPKSETTENDCDIVEIRDKLKENLEKQIVTEIKNEKIGLSSESIIEKEGHLNGTSTKEQVHVNGTSNGVTEKQINDSDHLMPTNSSKNSAKPDENCECPSPESERLLENLIEICTSAHIEKKLRISISANVEKMKRRFNCANVDYINSKDFKNIVLKQINHVKKKPRDAAVCFREVWSELNVHRKREVLLNYSQDRHVKKLEKTLRKLNKAIKKLEEKEVDWDDEGDSTYIQLERYKARFVAVHEKYCKILKSDRYAGRILHQKLDFSASKYPEINRAIDKLYQKDKKMPNISEIDEIVKKTVKESKINLGEFEIDNEVKTMHKSLGNLIQRRRKSELDDIINGFLGCEQDPAIEDPKLKEQLDKQLKEGEKKLDSVFEMYTKKQLEGENPQVSSDSDDSNLSESGGEDLEEFKDQRNEEETSK